ncbi:MAG: lipocalin-like domain-containing protein [Bryobacteraceae bacterium]|nr:lipocalin-like domain-containing protein [Bryobacteraceae bacterium]
MRALLVLFLTFPLLAADPRKQLTGTWRLVSYERTTPAGITEAPFGKTPAGRLIYDGKGRMSTHMMRPGRPSFSEPQLRNGTPAEIEAAYRGYLAYWGTYTVNARDKVILHRIEGSLYPNWVGSEQRRPFSFERGRLVLISDSSLGRAKIVWEKLP